MSRPALASPFEIVVTHPGGFDGPVTLAVSRDYLGNYVTWRWRRAASVIDSVPLDIVEKGQLIDRTLAAERLPVEEVLEAARQNGIDTLDKVRLAVLETTGRISFIRYDDTAEPRPPIERAG